MIGKVASNAADCIAVAASRPGRQELEVGDARRALLELPASTYVPSPRPIAVRNRTGLTGTS